RCPADQTLVAVHERSGHGGQPACMMQHSSHEPAAQLRETVFCAIVKEKVPAGFCVSKAEMIVRSVTREMSKWLWHERGPQALLLRHCAHHPFEEGEAVGRGHRIRIEPVDFELAIGVFVI